MEWALETGCDYIVSYDDDIIPCEDFVNQVKRFLIANPEDRIWGFYFSSVSLDRGEYSPPMGSVVRTRDSLTGVCSCYSRGKLKKILAWQDEFLDGDAFIEPDDFLINIYAMCNWECTYHPIPSLVEHGDPDNSSQGNEDCAGRRASVPPPPLDELQRIEWSGNVIDAGRLYTKSHWQMLIRVKEPLKHLLNTIAVERSLPPTEESLRAWK